MKIWTFLFLVIFFSHGNAQISKEIKAKLLKDLVVESANKYTFREVNLLSNKVDKSVQILITSESQKDYISRDNFLSTINAISFMAISGMYSTEELEKYDIKEMDDLIGSPDVTIKILMTKDGVQILVTRDHNTKKETLSWDELIYRPNALK